MTQAIRTATPALDKIILILDYLSKHNGSTFTDIFQATELPKSSASSLLNSLVTHGLLRQEKNKFFLGLRLYEYGKIVEDIFDIKKFAEAPLTELRNKTELTCHLGVLEGAAAVYLLKLESPSAIVVRSWVGKRLSLHSSGLGKALLAWLPEQKIDALLPEESFSPRTPTTITSKTALKQELESIKKNGWAFDNEEDSEGVFCIAAPIFDGHGQVVAAISASGVAFQVTQESIPLIVDEIKKAAQAISEKIS